MTTPYRTPTSEINAEPPKTIAKTPMQPKVTPLSTMSKGSAGGRAVSIDLDAEFDAEFGDEGPRGGNGGGLVETSMPVWLQPNSVGKDSIGAPAVATHTQEDEWGFGGGTAVSNLFGGGIRAPIKGCLLYTSPSPRDRG